MGNYPLATLILFQLIANANAQPVQIDAHHQMPVYPTSPATQPAAPERDDGTGRFYVVSEPMLFVWPALSHAEGPALSPAEGPALSPPGAPGPADNRPGAAIIVCPGGGYDHVTMEPEGQRIAKWLNPMGIAVFGLKYRTKPPSVDVAADALADGERAMRLVRSRAAEWKVDPQRVGMLGYSAGANLILNVASHFDPGDPAAGDPVERISSRPDFVVLLSTWPNRLPLSSYPLRADSPPTFIAIAKDDRTAPPTFTYDIKARLDELKIPVRLYETDRGGHGAFVIDGRNADTGWKEPLVQWLAARGALGK